jgi:hypothetical protein
MSQPRLVRAAEVLIWVLATGMVLMAVWAAVAALVSFVQGNEDAPWHAGGAGFVAVCAFLSVMTAMNPSKRKKADVAGVAPED